MKFSTKILIDNVVGGPSAFALDRLARFFALFVRHDHSLNKPFRTIVVSKFVGMGSILQMTPLIRTLKENYPEARIVFLTSTGMSPFVSRLGLIEEIITVDDRNLGLLLISSLSALLRLWRLKADLYLDFELFSNFSCLHALFSCARNRVGFFKRSFQYRSGIYNYLIYYNVKVPISDVFDQVARLLGCRSISKGLVPLTVTPSDKLRLESIFKTLFNKALPAQYVVINPNASDLRIERRWMPERFVELVNRSAARFPEAQFILIGVPAEKEHVALIEAGVDTALRSRIFNLTGALAISDLVTLINGADLLVSNDSGPMHIAFAQGVTSLTLWGPGHPEQFGNFSTSYAVYKNVYCSPCIYEFEVPPCKGENACMRAIAVEEVYSAVESILSGRWKGRETVDRAVVFAHPDGRPLGLVVK